MMRFSLGLVLVALTLSAACGYTRFDLPAPAASTDPTEPALALAPTSAPVPQSPCRPAITPQPTQAPSPSAPARALTLTPLPKFPRPSGASQLITRRFYSAALDQDMRFLIYLPPGYGDTPRRYPVLYMLSGYDGDPHEWVNWGLCDALESLIRNGQIQPLIVVMPDGDKSWWFNHAPPPASDGKRYGDYVWQDLVSYIDANYRTLRQSQSRAIGGLSAGGQSALTLAMTHPEVFGVVGAHSPSFRGADGSVAVFGDWDFYNQYDPFWLAEHTDAARRLTLWIDVAAGDYQWRDCNPPPSPQRCIVVFHTLLEAKGIPHDWRDAWPGIHDGYYWSEHLNDYLIWYASKLVGEDIP